MRLRSNRDTEQPLERSGAPQRRTMKMKRGAHVQALDEPETKKKKVCACIRCLSSRSYSSYFLILKSSDAY